jgi:hypothetical protein
MRSFGVCARFVAISPARRATGTTGTTDGCVMVVVGGGPNTDNTDNTGFLSVFISGYIAWSSGHLSPSSPLIPYPFTITDLDFDIKPTLLAPGLKKHLEINADRKPVLSVFSVLARLMFPIVARPG